MYGEGETFDKLSFLDLLAPHIPRVRQIGVGGDGLPLPVGAPSLWMIRA